MKLRKFFESEDKIDLRCDKTKLRVVEIEWSYDKGRVLWEGWG